MTPIETVAIESLSSDPANVRRHPTKNLDAIKGSLARFGQQKPIVVDAKGVIRAGNGTFEAAKALGWTSIQVVRTDLKGSEATAFAIADNRSGELAEWDEDALVTTLQSLQAEDFELNAVGFTGDEVNDLIGDLGRALSAEQVDFSTAPPTIQQNIEEMEEIKAQRRKGDAGIKEKMDTERYVMVVFSTREEKSECLKRLGLPEDERYIAASAVSLIARGVPRRIEASNGRTAKSATPDKAGSQG